MNNSPELDSASEYSSRAAERLVEAIDTALQKYGASVARVVYYEFEKSYGLKKEDIPREPEEFERLLNQFFGAGSPPVTTTILRELEKSTGDANIRNMTLAPALRQSLHHWLREL